MKEWYNALTLEAFNSLSIGYLSAGGVSTGFFYNPMTVHDINDNFLVSAVAACIPGMISNLDKLHQIYCREVYCLENEVPGGIPASLCAELRDQQICKYFIGELLELVPLIAGLDQLFGVLKALISDFFGTIYNLTLHSCTVLCPVNGIGVGICNVAAMLKPIVVVFNAITSALQEFPAIGEDYCSMIEDSEEAAEEAAAEETAASTSEASPVAVPTEE